MSSRCVPCDRSFSSEKALQQHLRDSPVHSPSSDCDDCDRSFNSEEALQQHLRDSPAHAPSLDCETCDRSFSSEEALQQHLRDSPVHSPSFDCDDCDRSFNSEEALQQHLRDSPNHRQDTETPLDVFFHSFPTFDYDPSLPPATSYVNLRRHEGWRRNSVTLDNAWNRYQDALQSELHMWYGSEDALTAWHALCRAIGVEPLPKTCEQCEEVGDCNEVWWIHANAGYRLYEGRTLILLIWLNGDEVAVRKKFRPFATWQSYEPTPKRQARYFATRSTKKAAMLS